MLSILSCSSVTHELSCTAVSPIMCYRENKEENGINFSASPTNKVCCDEQTVNGQSVKNRF